MSSHWLDVRCRSIPSSNLSTCDQYHVSSGFDGGERVGTYVRGVAGSGRTVVTDSREARMQALGPAHVRIQDVVPRRLGLADHERNHESADEERRDNEPEPDEGRVRLHTPTTWAVLVGRRAAEFRRRGRGTEGEETVRPCCPAAISRHTAGSKGGRE